MARFIIPATLLKAIVLAAVSHAADRDGSVISGVLVETDETTGEIRVVSTDGYRLYDRTLRASEMISGSFPNYRQIIPVSYDHAVTVDRQALMASLKAMPGVAVDGHAITLTCNGKVEISGSDKLGNRLASSLPLMADPRHPASTPELPITFNASYLGDALKAMEASTTASARGKRGQLADTVTIRLNGSVQAAMLSPGEESDPDADLARTLLMPIRT